MSIPSEGTSAINNTQSNVPNISNEGPMQLTDLTASEDVNVKKIIVHRQNLRLDLVEAFKTVSLSDSIRFIIVNARGEKEPGVCAGCERDIYSSAWKEILDGLLIGERERVTSVRHDLHINECSSMAKILGFMDTKYFPLQLRKAFITHVLFGQKSNDCFIKSFLNYVTPRESKIIEAALRGTSPQFYDDDDFLDISDRFNCIPKVTIMNGYGVILEFAKQELVQKPYMMLCSWKKFLSALKTFTESSTVFNVHDYYRHILPTNSNVIKLIQSDPTNGNERDALRFLKQCIRGLDEPFLRKSLKYCTGSDVILVDKIAVEFAACSTIAWRPIRHTCAPMMELPSSYASYCEFREEMQNILNVCDNCGIDII